ncbi:polysaccharide pyruvyl transferase family protein [Sphingobacterium sp. InxBP1]|uniref:polysaccharide pyruvyl transferase family protein n=1 Tax=Sphingobacterium sp. InxBP1 TaxID=2870328 RepID=UPI00224361F1|nr:polysaccharide pyruvyl transferase family protein [Sphingobacterium sp. InxBP1]MCW8310877.1 polysaccharide pyruvyl transferase family protein [Sphingobacterium sp. InxBP1]
MKIALLTFHNAANYGAALQAFALQKALDEKGYENVYINYQNEHRINSYSVSYLVLSAVKKFDIKGAMRYLAGSPFLLQRKTRFNTFYRRNLRCTKRIYNSSSEAESLNDQYTKFIVGSDQVWNWSNNGADDSYLLSFVKDNNKKISYSSSFGVAEISDDLKAVYQMYLSEFSHLAVREQHGIEIVKGLIGRNPRLVLDPVFLLSKEQWLTIADAKKFNDRFIFSYTNKPNQLEKFLSTTNLDLTDTYLYKLSRNIKISDFLDKTVKVKYTMSPSKFLSVVRDAELIVSASFHCVSLAIILNKPFVAILTGNRGKDERLTNILSLLDLNNRIYSENMTKEDIKRPIDYDRVNIKIEELKLSSLEYLWNAIES